MFQIEDHNLLKLVCSFILLFTFLWAMSQRRYGVCVGVYASMGFGDFGLSRYLCIAGVLANDQVAFPFLRVLG